MSPRLISPQELLRSEKRLFILLCLIGGLLVLEPILSRFVAARIFLHIFLTAIVISMVYIISGKKRHTILDVLQFGNNDHFGLRRHYAVSFRQACKI